MLYCFLDTLIEKDSVCCRIKVTVIIDGVIENTYVMIFCCFPFDEGQYCL